MRSFTVPVLVFLGVMASALRFVAPEQSPPGFYVDEAAIAAQVICHRQSGADLSGQAVSFFVEVLAGGYATPATIHAGGWWTSVWGDSISAVRSFSALQGVLTVIGVFF